MLRIREGGTVLKAVYPVLGKQTTLPFYVSGIGICEPEYRVSRPQGLVSHQFLITSSGSGKLIVGEREYILKEGSIFYLPPELPHEYMAYSGQWNTKWLVFRGEHADDMMKRMGFDGCVVCDMPVSERMTNLFSQIINCVKEPVSGGERSSPLLYEFIMLARELMLIGQSDDNKNLIADRAISYIDEHYSEDITLDELASLSGVSAQYFCRVFRSSTGMRPIEYINNKRVSEAKLLLVSRDMQISDIAFKVGFRDNNYFGIVFRRATGISPREFRLRRS